MVHTRAIEGMSSVTETPRIEGLRMFACHREPIRRARGFEPHHRVPRAIDHQSLSFVEQLTRRAIDDELQNTFDRIREAFAFKRRELSVHGPEQRRGVIETPRFVYELAVDLSQDDPTQLRWCRELTKVQFDDADDYGKLDRCVPPSDWTLEWTLVEPIDLGALIDHLEECDIAQMSLRFDKALAWCELTMTEIPCRLRFLAGAIQLVPDGMTRPGALLRALTQFQTSMDRSLVRRLVPAVLWHDGNSSATS